jgi:hypothetical protein
MDSQGPLGYSDVTEDTIRAEVQKAVENYGKDAGFVIFPMFLGNNLKDISEGKEWRTLVVKDELERFNGMTNPL